MGRTRLLLILFLFSLALPAMSQHKGYFGMLANVGLGGGYEAWHYHGSISHRNNLKSGLSLQIGIPIIESISLMLEAGIMQNDFVMKSNRPPGKEYVEKKDIMYMLNLNVMVKSQESRKLRTFLLTGIGLGDTSNENLLFGRLGLGAQLAISRDGSKYLLIAFNFFKEVFGEYRISSEFSMMQFGYGMSF